MDLTLTGEQRFIRDEARRLLSSRADSARLRQVIEAGTGHDPGLWATLARELGWCAMTVPAEHGGLGLGLTELVLLVEAAGERLAPVPLWSTACLATPLLAAIGSEAAKAAFLPRIANGELSASVAFAPADPAAPAARATDTGDGYQLEGTLRQVVEAGAGLVLVQASLHGAGAWFALEHGSGHTVRLLPAIDPLRQIGVLVLDGVNLPASARIDDGAPGADRVATVLAIAGLGLAAEQVGAARGVMDLTLGHLAGRVQFGRSIASFQAIKHRCARIEVDLAEARALVYGIAATAGGDDPRVWLMEVAGLRMLAQDLLFRAAEEAIQLHGGAGCTWDHDPHLYLRRAQADRWLLGDPEARLDGIAAHVLDGGAAA